MKNWIYEPWYLLAKLNLEQQTNYIIFWDLKPSDVVGGKAEL